MEEVWLTGAGLVCAAGDGIEACWDALNERRDLSKIHPVFGCTYYPIEGLDSERYFPRPADHRQTGDMMRYGISAAAQAISSLGDDLRARSRLQMCIAAPAGERDLTADEAVLAASFAADRPSEKNRKLMRTRPSLYLAQLPNLLGANIGIVHGLSIPSRTLMGSEPAGLEAFRQVFERIRFGEAEIVLAGAAKNGGCAFATISAAYNGWLRIGPYDSLWSSDGGGYCLGSVGAFLIVESRRHAEARGVQAIARVAAVNGPSINRDDCDLYEVLRDGKAPATRPGLLMMSGISGCGEFSVRERARISQLSAASVDVVARAPARVLGHSVEASVFLNLVLGARCIKDQNVFAPCDADEEEENPLSAVERVLVTCWGSGGGEGFIVLERAT